jgi:hypothetical protein
MRSTASNLPAASNNKNEEEVRETLLLPRFLLLPLAQETNQLTEP